MTKLEHKNGKQPHGIDQIIVHADNCKHQFEEFKTLQMKNLARQGYYYKEYLADYHPDNDTKQLKFIMLH